MIEPATLAIIAATPATLRALLSGLPRSAVERTRDGGWSSSDIVAHLLDRGRIQRARVEQLLDQPGSLIEDSDEAATLEASGLRSWPFTVLLDEFTTARSADVERYGRLAAADLDRGGVHSVAGNTTVANLINQAAYHDLLHLRQIADTLATIPHEGRGPLAMFG